MQPDPFLVLAFKRASQTVYSAATLLGFPTSANYWEAPWFITFIMVYWSKQRWRDSLYARALSWMCAGISTTTRLAVVFRWDEAGYVSSLALRTVLFEMLEGVCLLCYEVSARTLFKCNPLQTDKHGYESFKKGISFIMIELNCLFDMISINRNV